MGRSVFIGIPSYSWTVYLPTMRSLMADCMALAQRGDTFTIYDEAVATEISQARNQIVDAFLHSNCTDLVFVDADVNWQAGSLLKLVDYPVDFVAGIYRKRIDNEEYPVRWMKERDTLIADPETGLLEVEAVPGGFVALTRQCVAHMSMHYAETLTQRTDRALNETWTALFDPMWVDGVRLPEDFTFCHRWRDMGGTVWIDPEITMGHCGPKAFTGSIGSWLRNR